MSSCANESGHGLPTPVESDGVDQPTVADKNRHAPAQGHDLGLAVMGPQLVKQILGDLFMIAGQRVRKAQGGFLARREQIAVLKMGQGVDHFLRQTLLPRRGIHGRHSKLAFVDLGHLVPNQFGQLHADPVGVDHNMGVVKIDEVFVEVRGMGKDLYPFRPRRAPRRSAAWFFADRGQPSQTAPC